MYTRLVTLSMVILGVLADGPAHGYDLKRMHDARFPAAKPLPYGQVYATLGRLERDGLVETIETQQEAGPERTVYAATDAGRAEVRGWLEATEKPSPYAAEELVRKTITALHLGIDSADYLRRQRTEHLGVMRELTKERAAATEPGARIALDHTLAHLDADLRWLEETRERVAHDPRGVHA